MRPRKIWMTMSDQALTDTERKIDAMESQMDSFAQRNKQLRTQRRRALRRALSLERLVREIMRTAAQGTAEEVTAVFQEAERILNIPLHQAVLAAEEPEDA